MKTCLICGASVADNAPSCPKCGEASWGAVAVAVVSEPGSTPGTATLTYDVRAQPKPQPQAQQQHHKGRR